MHDVDICSWLLTLWQTQDHKPTIWGWIIPPIQGFAIGLNALQSTEPTSPARLQWQHYSGKARATQRVEIHQTATKIWRWKVGSWHLTVEILRDVAFTIFDYSKIKVKDLDRGKRDSANKFWIITTTVVAVAALFTIQNPGPTSNTRETTHKVVIRHDKTHGNTKPRR